MQYAFKCDKSAVFFNVKMIAFFMQIGSKNVDILFDVSVTDMNMSSSNTLITLFSKQEVT